MTEILRRQIRSFAISETWAFEPIRAFSDPGSVELFLHHPQAAKPVIRQPLSNFQSSIRSVPHASILRLKNALAVGPLLVHGDDKNHNLPTVKAEWDLLEGLNVIVGMLNGEPIKSVIEWLVWHILHHNAEAVLLIDRGNPAEVDALQTELQKLISTDKNLEPLKYIVVVGFDHPLGLSELGPEGHPLYAPDAPGKEMMEQPAPDPWRANLGFTLIYDLMRSRFLGNAKSVLRTEVMDLVHPGPDGQSIFDALTNTPHGVISLVGDMVYPWALRRKDVIAHGHHTCLRFDSLSKQYSWCVQPGRLTDDLIWMPHRVLGLTSPGAAEWPFWRCMALRYGDDSNKISRIVAKSSLKEDAGLLAMAKQMGIKPKRAADIKQHKKGFLPVRDVKGHRTVIVTTMKNEGPFILEWLAYHRAIGISDFLIYTNDCTDGTDSFLQLLASKGYVQWRENPYREVKMKPQHAALDAAHSEPLIYNADWVTCIDVDEYITIHTGDGTLGALYTAVPSANIISLTWRLFGNANRHEFRDDFITQNFTQAAREFTNKPHQAWGFKSLFRNEGLFRKLGVHRPKGLRPHAYKKINWVNGSGKPLPKNQWRNAWRSNGSTYGYDLVSLNHYAVRSAESFLVKRDRGRVNHVDRDQGMAYWFRMNHNTVQDDRMHKKLPLLQAEYDKLMADPEIAAAHHAAVMAHREKIDELKKQQNYAAFYADLTGPRLEKLSRLHGHFGANIYLAGPDVIPDEIIAKDPDEEFFFTVDKVEETQH